MSPLAPPAAGAPHARHTAAAAQRVLCSPDQGNEPPGTCAGSMVGRAGGGGESCRGKAASPRFAKPALGRADGAAGMACPGSRTPGAVPAQSARCPPYPVPAWPVLPAPPSVQAACPAVPFALCPPALLECAGDFLGRLVTASGCSAAGSGGFISRAAGGELSARRSPPQCCLSALRQVFGEERCTPLDAGV